MTIGSISRPWGTPGYSSLNTKYISDFPNGPWTSNGVSWSGIYDVKSWSGTDMPTVRFAHPYSHTYYVYVDSDRVSYSFGSRSVKAKRKQAFSRKRVKRTFRYGGTKTAAKKEWHPYSMSQTRQYYPLQTGTIKNVPGYGSQYVMNYSFITFFNEGSWLHLTAPPVWDANDEIKLVGKLRERVMGHDFNPSIFFAEGLEAVEMISYTASRMAASLISLKRNVARLAAVDVEKALLRPKRPSRDPSDGRLKQLLNDPLIKDPLKYLLGQKDPDQLLKGIKLDSNFKRVPLRDTPRERLVSSLWLEAQFGWMPLLSDIQSGAEFLALQALNKPAKQQWVAYKKKFVDKPTLDSLSSYYKFSKAECFTLRKIVFRATEDPQTTVAYSGILDPELVAWELLPYSFLWDYLQPVGDYLEARAFSQRLKGAFLTTTLSVVSEQNPIPQGAIYGSFGPVVASKVSMVRSTSTSLNVPLPKLKSADKIFSFTRLGNVFALLGVATSGRGLPRH